MRKEIKSQLSWVLIATLALALVVMSARPAAAAEKVYKAKATWYAYGTHGAGGKLKPGDVAITNSWRKAHKIKYGDKIYVKAPKKYKLTGWHRVRDTGCGYRNGQPTIDFWYKGRSAVPSAFKRAGVVSVKITKIKRK